MGFGNELWYHEVRKHQLRGRLSFSEAGFMADTWGCGDEAGGREKAEECLGRNHLG